MASISGIHQKQTMQYSQLYNHYIKLKIFIKTYIQQGQAVVADLQVQVKKLSQQLQILKEEGISIARSPTDKEDTFKPILEKD